MSEKRWLSVHSRKDLFQEVDLGWHNSRNITAEDLQEMLDNDEPIPNYWYRRTDQGFEISESLDNILHAVRTIEYETDGKIDWCVLACSVIQDVAASDRPIADGLCCSDSANPHG
jgi:hypothetical protein